MGGGVLLHKKDPNVVVWVIKELINLCFAQHFCAFFRRCGIDIKCCCELKACNHGQSWHYSVAPAEKFIAVMKFFWRSLFNKWVEWGHIAEKFLEFAKYYPHNIREAVKMGFWIAEVSRRSSWQYAHFKRKFRLIWRDADKCEFWQIILFCMLAYLSMAVKMDLPFSI